jgi:ABC-type polysaccharide/polyol phosphate export permease
MENKNIHYYNTRLQTYYETVAVVAIKNLKLRYRNSFLGFLWTLINPLFMLSIFVFVFGKVINDIENYPLYVLSGLMFWNFFTSSSNQMINKILESGGILKSVNIPPIIFPLSALISNLMNFVITFIPFFGLMMVFGYKPSFVTLLLIPYLILFSIFTFGVSMILCCFNVYFRDVEMFWTTITPALFYATPVVYKSPESIQKYMIFNPFAHFMEMAREILYWNRIPSLESTLFVTGLSLFFLGLAVLVYNNLRRGFIANF